MRISSLLLIMLFLSGCHAGDDDPAGQLLYDKLIRPADAVYYHVPVGLCEDYPEETTTLEIIRNDMEFLKAAEVNLLRISFGWDGIEEEKDVYNWLFWDDFVRMAVDEYGVTLIPYICYTPMWNSTGDSTNFWNHPPQDYEQFGTFMYALVNRYKDRIKSWEIWNEPDIEFFWNGSIEDFVKLYKIGAEAVRKADPEAIVVLGGLAHKVDFLESLFRDFEISPYVDIVNFHSYLETWDGHPAEDIIEYVHRVADVVGRYGDHQPLWMAEVGYSTFRYNEYVSIHYNAYYDYEKSPEYQAVHLFRTLTMLLSTEKLSAIAWYEIKDLEPEEEVIGDVNNRHLGIAYTDWSPKPAKQALRFFNRLFSQPNRSIDEHVIVDRQYDSDSHVFSFETTDGSVIIVGWLQTNVPHKRSQDTSGMVRDTREESVSVTLPVTLTGDAVVYDELGNERIFTAIEREADRTVLHDLALHGGGITIVKIYK
jgi:polysaccharide biosynthesis protein PslG